MSERDSQNKFADQAPAPHDPGAPNISELNHSSEDYIVTKLSGEIKFRGYAFSTIDGGETILQLESFRVEGGNPSYYTCEWESTMPVEQFLEQVDGFLTKYTSLNPEPKEEISLTVSDAAYTYHYGRPRPIRVDDLLEQGGENREDELAELTYVGLESLIGFFMWQPKRSGFRIAPENYPHQPALQTSLRDFFTASHPTVRTNTFEAGLSLVTSDILEPNIKE